MAHELMRLSGEVFNKPQLIDAMEFAAISQYLQSRNASLFSSSKKEGLKPSQADVAGDIAVIKFHGASVYRESMATALCGMTSYEGILNQASSAISSGIKTIVLEIDSGGGSAQGCFATANTLAQNCLDANVNLVAFIDGRACSAAYAFACVANEVIAEPFAEVGSIGVLVAMQDTSERDKMEGVSTIYVSDGLSKVPVDNNGKFKQDFLDDLQLKITSMGDAFRVHVNNHTGVSITALKDTQAKVFSSDSALSIGLINKIMTKAEFARYITDKD